MIWAPIKIVNQNWNKNFELLTEYKIKHHKFSNVSYITEDGTNLGLWIERQRNIYKYKMSYNNISDTDRLRIEKLNKLNMIWDASKLLVNTLFQEKTIFYYLKQRFSDVTKMSQQEFIGYELDVFIPSIRTAIEYDGIWHKSNLNKDLEKDLACKKNNITLIRIREPNLPKINDNSYIIKLQKVDNKNLEKALKAIFKRLNLKDIDFNIQKNQAKIIESYKDFTSQCWDNSYEKVYSYYKNNNDISSNIRNMNISIYLKNWLYNQRNLYKNNLLTRIQIDKLEKLNFIWCPTESEWQKMYKFAKIYYKKFKNLLIPNSFVVESNIKLGNWLSTQRYNYKNNKLNLNRIFSLEKIGMIWSIKENFNNQMMNEIIIYCKKYGNLNIPTKYVTENNLTLGKWLARQKNYIKKELLSETMIVFLNKFNINWNYFNDKWEEMFKVALSYYESNSNIWISANYITSDGIYLGSWISHQRKKFNNIKKLSNVQKIQMEKLNSINMVWNPYEIKRMEKYKIAKQHFKKMEI